MNVLIKEQGVIRRETTSDIDRSTQAIRWLACQLHTAAPVLLHRNSIVYTYTLSTHINTSTMFFVTVDNVDVVNIIAVVSDQDEFASIIFKNKNKQTNNTNDDILHKP